MSRRYQAGFIFPGYDPLEVPDAPTIGTATGGDEQLSVTFTAPADTGGGAITAYNAVAITGGATVATGTNTASPVTITGLTNGTAYTAKVWAINAYGPSPLSAASGSVTPSTIGLFAGGTNADNTRINTISYISLGTTGNSADFGDLTTTRTNVGGLASSTRGVFSGGNDGSNLLNVIDYVTIASTGNAIDFGDNLLSYDIAGLSNNTRGIWAGGKSGGGSDSNIISYITIASTGNALDFGDIAINTGGGYGACASPTRGVFAGPDQKANEKKIYYVTIASTGNSSSFGDLNTGRTWSAGASNSTRGLFGGGYNNDFAGNRINHIDYVTIASTGNATDFGDLTVARYYLAGCASSTRAVFAGGSASTGNSNVMDYVTIASAGNATDFGDLFVAQGDRPGGCSSGHGGLQ